MLGAKSKNMKYFTKLIFFILAGISCADEIDLDCENINCLAIFKSYSIRVKYSDGNPVRLDKYITVRERKNKEIDIQSRLDGDAANAKRRLGSYPVLNDTHDDLIRYPRSYSKGYIANKLVVQEEFVFRKDCCGVYKVSGPYEVVII